MARPETGPMKFGDDWTGTFVRGDVSLYYAAALKQVLNGTGHPVEVAALEGLLKALQLSEEGFAEPQRLKSFDECVVE